MNHRKENLRKLIDNYYAERGWNSEGIPTVATLERLGLWQFLKQEARDRITELAG
jgi:aldehyde:ferredoxin oxidoreductase